MTRLASVLLGLAAVVATLPAPVAAASPNQLVDPRVSPASGTTDSTFAFSVRYVSQKGWAATSVSVSVGGRTIALKRTAGTPLDGTWSGSARLPAGTWPTTFGADAEQGPDPTASGPTLTVTAAATPKPATPPPVTPPPATPPPATPPPATPPPPTPAPATSVAPAATASPAAAETSSPAATPHEERESPAASPATSPDGSRRATPRPEAAAGTTGGDHRDADAAALGILAIAALVVGGGAVALVWQRRRPPDEEAADAAPAPLPTHEAPRAPSTAARRARIDPIGADDPILVAMGVGRERHEES